MIIGRRLYQTLILIIFVSGIFNDLFAEEHIINSIQIIDKDTVIDNDFVLIFKEQGAFFIKNGIKVEVKGLIKAKRNQIFFGPGSIKLENCKNDYAYPEWWGAYVNDTICDAEAIENAISTKKRVVLQNQSTYKIKRTINVALTEVNLISENDIKPAKIEVVGNINCFELSGLPLDTFKLECGLKEQQMFIKTKEKLKANKKDLMILKSNKLWYHDNRDYLYKGETNAIKSINGDSITLFSRIKDYYELNKETVLVYTYKPIKVSICNLIITGINNYRNSAIIIKYGRNILLDNLSINQFGYSGIKLTNCYISTISNSYITNISNEKTGYGIQDFGSYNTEVKRCFFKHCRRGVDFSGITPSRNGVVENCIIEGGGVAKDGTDMIRNYGSSGLGTHGTADSMVFKNNIITNVKAGFIIRGQNITIKDNSLHGRIEMLVSQPTGKNLTISYNKYHIGTIEGDNNSFKYSLLREFIRIGPEVSHKNCITIENNDILALRGNFIYIIGKNNLNELIIKGNNITIDSNSSKNIVSLIKFRESYTIPKLYEANNLILIKRGKYKKGL